MACEKPNYMIDFGVDEKTGKHNTRFIYNLGKDNLDYRNLGLLKKMNMDGVSKVFAIPCGKCPSCVKAYRRQWSLRCEAEAKLHDISCFITLTYDPAHDPGHLVKDDLKKFIKKLRNRGIAVRYFGCGEIASKPHYHIILFGYMPDDLSLISKSKTGFYLYKSKFIENLWQKGLCTVQEFDSAVAGYVAGYVDKKINDGTGFLIMSNRPGIGHDYYIKNLFKLYEHDRFVSKNGFVAPLPRYADKVADQFFYDLEPVKEARRKKQEEISVAQLNAHGFSYFEDVFEHQGLIERRKQKYARSL